MKNYTYTGSQTTTFTLNDGKDYILVPGNQYMLPSENKHIETLVAMKQLIEVETKKAKNEK